MLRALCLPFWLCQVLSQQKSFERNPIIGNRWLNEKGLHTLRLKVAHRLAAARRARLVGMISPEDRKHLDRDGFLLKPGFLPEQVFGELVAQVRALRAASRELIEGDTITRRIALDPHVVTRVPAARHLLDSAEYHSLIRYAASSAAAPMIYIQTILPWATEGPPDPQTLLHADTFHPTVKAWLFLTDVAPDSAAFSYVPRSHRLTAQRLAWERRMSVSARASPNAENRQGSFRIGPHELKEFGFASPLSLPVRANTLLVADTFGFHARGPCTRPTIRVEIWAYARRNPFLPWTGFDPWSGDMLRLRKSTFHWDVLDILDRAGLAHQRWRPRGQVSAFDAPAPPPNTVRDSARLAAE
jgi:hypothetical protein